MEDSAGLDVGISSSTIRFAEPSFVQSLVQLCAIGTPRFLCAPRYSVDNTWAPALTLRLLTDVLVSVPEKDRSQPLIRGECAQNVPNLH
jgi:hypothetical protein